MRYELVIFDLDGTILDTLADLTDSLNAALEKNGYPRRSLQEVRSFVGNGIRRLIERSVPQNASEERIAEVHQDFTQHYRQHCADKTQPYRGIPELLQKLRAEGCKLAVISNKADYAVQKLCETYFKGSFDIVSGERAGIPKKPAPDAVNDVLRRLKTDRERAVYVGDSDVDIETAKNAGIDYIIVDWGFRDAVFLREHGADVIVSTPDKILELSK
jgi:phosphoglycolate phosphatase